VQFIGGEPTLNKNLPAFISRARSLGYEFVEVFTNLTRLSPRLLENFIEHNVSVATSVYAGEADIHDEVTTKRGSFDKTMRNIDAVLEAGLPLRAGVISMPLNEDRVDDTVSFLRARGVKDVGSDRVRDFGRASGGKDCDRLDNLCGKCAGPTLCVSPNGGVSPCIMSKTWSVGSMLETPLAQLISSSRLSELRKEIFDKAVAPREKIEATGCEPSCSPSCYPSCVPACAPSCVPSCVPSCAPSCVPSAPGCSPSR
jgi:sulfatase maturation enzyme AslB (radical SAM superfamily)